MDEYVARYEDCINQLEAFTETKSHEFQDTHRKSIQILYTMKEMLPSSVRYVPHLVVRNATAKETSELKGFNHIIFNLLNRYIRIYSNLTPSPLNNAFASANISSTFAFSSPFTNTIDSISVTSECIQKLVCDCLVATYDYRMFGTVTDAIASKQSSLYIKVTFIMVVSRLSDQDALPLLPGIISISLKVSRQADFYLRQCLLQSIMRLMDREPSRTAVHQADAFKLASRATSDKQPEVRLAAARLLYVIAKCAVPTLDSAVVQKGGRANLKKGCAEGGMQHEGGSSAQQGMDVNDFGDDSRSKSENVDSGLVEGEHRGQEGRRMGFKGFNMSNLTSSMVLPGRVSLDALMHTAVKGFDDTSPETRRVCAMVAGVVLSKHASMTDQDLPMHTVDDQVDTQSRVLKEKLESSPPRNANIDSLDSEAAIETNHEPAATSVSTNHMTDVNPNPPSRPKLAFKLPSMHAYGIAGIQLTLSRRRSPAIQFLTISSIVLFFKDLMRNKYFNPPQSRHNGNAFALFSIGLCKMFDRLPKNILESIHQQQLVEIIDSLTDFLDQPQFSLSDVQCARAAVVYVLRFGLFPVLSQRQHEMLWSVYVSKLHEAVTSGACLHDTTASSGIIDKQTAVIGGEMSEAKKGRKDSSHHKTLVILFDASHLISCMGEACIVHAEDASKYLYSLLGHEKQSIRYEASIVLASLSTTLPYRLGETISECISSLHKITQVVLPLDKIPSQLNFSVDKAILYRLQGYTTAIAHILRAKRIYQIGEFNYTVRDSVLDSICTLAFQLLESQFIRDCNDVIWLTCTRAGWTLISVLSSIAGNNWHSSNLQRHLDLFIKCSDMQNRDPSLELLRMEAASSALQSFTTVANSIQVHGENVAAKSVWWCAAHVLHQHLAALTGPLSNPPKKRGQTARYRLITCIFRTLHQMPDPMIYKDAHLVLLDLIAEITTGVSMTRERHGVFCLTGSRYLSHAMSSADDILEITSTPRLKDGDPPSESYSRDLNHVLELAQLDQTLSDVEVEIHGSDIFCRLCGDCTENFKSPAYIACSGLTLERLVDASILLFGTLLPLLVEDLQLRCLQHYAGVLADKRDVCDLNICSLLYAAVRGARSVAASKTTLSSNSITRVQTDSFIPDNVCWPSMIQPILQELSTSRCSQIRRGACEAIGILSSIVSDKQRLLWIQELERRLKKNTEIERPSSCGDSYLSNSHANGKAGSGEANDNAKDNILHGDVGAAFALACIKRCCGSRAAIDTSILAGHTEQFAQPHRTWILHAYTIIMESASANGQDQDEHIQTSLSLLCTNFMAGFQHSKINKKHLSSRSSTMLVTGRLLNSLVMIIGPDLGTNKVCLDTIYAMWDLLLYDCIATDPHIQIEFFKFLEQILIFAPQEFRVSDLLTILQVLSCEDVVHGEIGRVESKFVLSPHGFCTSESTSTYLQRLGLSCLRTLAEYDSDCIWYNQLHTMLMKALNHHNLARMWAYRPTLLGFGSRSIRNLQTLYKSQEIVGSYQDTIVALIDIGCRHETSSDPSLLALYFRGIAIGESAETIDANQQRLRSPTNRPQYEVVSTTTAASSQVQKWRDSKIKVQELLQNVPPLCRKVRLFAIECVYHILEVMAASTPLLTRYYPVTIIPLGGLSSLQYYHQFQVTHQNHAAMSKYHFNLSGARLYLADQIAKNNAAVENIDSLSKSSCMAGPHVRDNFLCFYLDELITLACQAATTSLEGHELVQFQCTGLRLLHLLIAHFGFSPDPEDSSGRAYVLETYQAHILSVVKHASKLCRQYDSSPSSKSERIISPQIQFFPAFYLQVQAIQSDLIPCRLVRDRIALGRLCKNCIHEDYDQNHYIGDVQTRKALSLVHLSCLATICVSAAGIRQDFQSIPSLDRLIATVKEASLYNELQSFISEHVKALHAAWIHTTEYYVMLSQGEKQWPSNENSTASYSNNLPQSSLAGSDTLKAVYKAHWSNIGSAMALSFLLEDADSHEGERSALYQEDFMLWFLSCALCHISTKHRDRGDVCLDYLIYLLPATFSKAYRHVLDRESVSLKSLLTYFLEVCMRWSLRSLGPPRILALQAIFVVLRDPVLVPLTSCHCENQVLPAIAFFRASCTPLEILRETCATLGSEECQTAEADLEVLFRFAMAGMTVLKQQNESITHVESNWIASVTQELLIPLACTEMFVRNRGLQESFLQLVRLSAELHCTKLITEHDDTTPQSVIMILRKNLCQLRTFANEHIESDRADQLRVILASSSIYIVSYRGAYPKHVAAMQITLMEDIAVMLSSAVSHFLDCTNDTDSQVNVISYNLHEATAILRNLNDFDGVGKEAVVVPVFKKLIPIVVTFIKRFRCKTQQSIASATGILEEVIQLLSAAHMILNDEMAAAFTQLLISLLVDVVGSCRNFDVAVDQSIVRIKYSQVLLHLARARSDIFKNCVATLPKAIQSELESMLRSAITYSKSSQSSMDTNCTEKPATTMPKPLDLSRYN